MSNTAEKKFDNLKKYLEGLESVAVAFSGGVDSTFLLKAAKEFLGEKILAVTVVSDLVPAREIEWTKNFCAEENIRQIIFDFDEFKVEGFSKNPKDRCYLCKREIFSAIKKIAAENKIFFVAEGSNMDDLGDYRPGLRAIKELDIKSPLQVAELRKDEIRTLSKKFSLPTWDKPSFACLASRFVYGETITREKLSAVAQAEDFLFDMGFKQFRVRVHGNLARIEIFPADFEKILQKELREKINSKLTALGFFYVTLDLQGYRTGSMNNFSRACW